MKSWNLFLVDHGDVFDHVSSAKAIRQVDAVISYIDRPLLGDQDKIISAIKAAGNIKRFFPSEFGIDVDRAQAVEPAKSAWDTKVKIRRAVETEAIPYTNVASNFFAGSFLLTLYQPGATAAPRDKIVILGDGNPKAVFCKEDDIAKYTIRAVDDPRTLNKILYIKPPVNLILFNDLVSLWEKKIGKTLERVNVPEEQLLKAIQGMETQNDTFSLAIIQAPVTIDVVLSIGHSVFAMGDHR